MLFVENFAENIAIASESKMNFYLLHERESPSTIGNGEREKQNHKAENKTHFPILTFALSPPQSSRSESIHFELQTTKTRNQIVYDLNNKIHKMNFDYINMKLC